jgi:hypothetical protein
LPQSGIAGAGVIKIGGALIGRQPPRSTKEGHFAIWGINHAKNSLSAL